MRMRERAGNQAETWGYGPEDSGQHRYSGSCVGDWGFAEVWADAAEFVWTTVD